MKLPRSEFLRLAAGGLVLPALERDASAQAYPSRPLRIVVGSCPSGTQRVVPAKTPGLATVAAELGGGSNPVVKGSIFVVASWTLVGESRSAFC
ncbi:MAG TPA: hypothetical protein VH678_00900 [Xanthobacteraceae bacterium]|jgi:hypothetical protein